MPLQVFVMGEPTAQGSKRHVGHGIMREENEAKLRPWREALAWQLHAERRGAPTMEGPVEVTLTFHLRAPRQPRQWWQRQGRWVAYAPDIDKLARAVLDAMTVAGVVADDGQVALLNVAKLYATERTGVAIVASQMMERPA